MMPWKFIAIYFIILVLRQVTSYQVGPRVLSRPPTSRPPTKQPVPFTRIPTTTTNQPTIGPAAIATSTPTVQPTEVPR
jgi:hypothetical protein